MERNECYYVDFQTRKALRAWSERKRLTSFNEEPAGNRRFNEEPTNPERVGISECEADEFDPEELVNMFDQDSVPIAIFDQDSERAPLVFDWDR